MLEAGDKAPDFTLPTDGGGTVTLSTIPPQRAVVYFYPKADTPGCTTEAVDFSRLAPEFAALGVQVIAISKDPPAKLDRFRSKHDLGVVLASDAESDTAEAWGVWGEKSLYGRSFMGITRATFLIGGDGRVLRVWPKVKVAGHAEAVLEAVRQS